MNTMSLSATTITTMIGVCLAVLLLMLYHRKMASMLMSVLAVIILILAFEAATGYKLLDLGELMSYIGNIIVRFFYWIEQHLWPELSSAVEDIANNLGS